MTLSSSCPDDRCELVSVLEGQATEELHAHVTECARCSLEVGDLRRTLELIVPAEEVHPSVRVRREAVSYARSQLRSSKGRRTRWRAPSTALFGVGLAVLFGGLAEARMAPSSPWVSQIITPEPWTLALAFFWGLALFLYSTPGSSKPRRDVAASALVAGAAFSVLTLICPIPTAVQMYATEMVGTDRLTLDQAVWAYAGCASLYALVASAFAGGVLRNPRPWYDACRTGLVFIAMAGPLFLVQATTIPQGVIIAGIAGLGCGAFTGSLLVRMVSRS